jgi:hypothetical protein
MTPSLSTQTRPTPRAPLGPRNRLFPFALLLFQTTDEVLSVCDKCDELDDRIERYRKLASGISDRLTLDAIADRIKEMEAQKVQFHPNEEKR